MAKVRVSCGVCGRFIKELTEEDFLIEYHTNAPDGNYLDFCSERCKAISDRIEAEMEKEAEDEWKFEQEQLEIERLREENEQPPPDWAGWR